MGVPMVYVQVILTKTRQGCKATVINGRSKETKQFIDTKYAKGLVKASSWVHSVVMSHKDFAEERGMPFQADIPAELQTASESRHITLPKTVWRTLDAKSKRAKIGVSNVIKQMIESRAEVMAALAAELEKLRDEHDDVQGEDECANSAYYLGGFEHAVKLIHEHLKSGQA